MGRISAGTSFASRTNRWQISRLFPCPTCSALAQRRVSILRGAARGTGRGVIAKKRSRRCGIIPRVTSGTSARCMDATQQLRRRKKTRDARHDLVARLLQDIVARIRNAVMVRLRKNVSPAIQETIVETEIAPAPDHHRWIRAELWQPLLNGLQRRPAAM